MGDRRHGRERRAVRRPRRAAGAGDRLARPAGRGGRKAAGRPVRRRSEPAHRPAHPLHSDRGQARLARRRRPAGGHHVARSPRARPARPHRRRGHRAQPRRPHRLPRRRLGRLAAGRGGGRRLRRRGLPRDPPGGRSDGPRDGGRGRLVGPAAGDSCHPRRARPPGRLRRQRSPARRPGQLGGHGGDRRRPIGHPARRRSRDRPRRRRHPLPGRRRLGGAGQRGEGGAGRRRRRRRSPQQPRRPRRRTPQPRRTTPTRSHERPDRPARPRPGLLDSLRRRRPPPLPAGEPGAVWATLLDALATLTGEAIAAVTHVVGPRERLVVFGGGSTSQPWLEAKARHAPLPVHWSTTRHAVARGAAVQAGVAAGWWPTAAAAPAPDLEPIRRQS